MLRIRLRTGSSNLPRLRYPVEPVPRVAVLGQRFQETRSVRLFPGDDWQALERYRPEAIAAPAHLLCEVIEAIRRGALRLAITHAVIIFARPGEELEGVDRELFWREFQVPLFEQRLDGAGRLIAWECEAHACLHLEPGAPLEGIERLCDCGHSATLLVSDARRVSRA